MKKLVSIFMLFLSALFLVACSSSLAASKMDGEYYSYYGNGEFGKSPDVVIEGDVLTWQLYDEPYLFKIDKEKQTLTGGPDGRTVPYFFEDGKLVFNANSSDMDYYLKDSPAYKELLEQKNE